MVSSSSKESAIVVRLAGGLGNQLFQLGAAMLIAHRQGSRKVFLDNYALSSYKLSRKFELTGFLDFSRSSLLKIEIRRFFINRARLPRIFTSRIFPNFLVGDNNFRSVVDSGICCSRIMDGYFQKLSQKDFEDMITLIQPLSYYRDIQLREVNIKTCVVHIRGGDFIDLGWIESTPKEYYAKSMQVMKDVYMVKSFLIVTDDISYAKSIINRENFHTSIVSNNISEDFWTIASHPKRILSSSTFAIWASALGKNDEDCVVIAPEELIPGIKRSFKLPNEI